MRDQAIKLLREVISITIQLPLGLIVAAATERFCRGSHPCAKWRNIGVKILVAYMLILLSLGHVGDGINANAALPEYISLSLRFLFLITGIVIGTAFQPVGLTGGIATGKSTLSSLLSAQGDETGFIIIDIDRIAHDILLPEKLGQDSVYNRLVKEFGSDILKDENTVRPLIDRRKLGDIVFSDRQKRMKLNSITHPKIIKIMLKQILVEGMNLNTNGSRQRRVVCVDIPLLFEGGLFMRMLFGTIIVVTCKPELQLERLHKRNSDLTIEQCRQRIASQIPVEEKARMAHKVIRNDGDIKALKSQMLRVKNEVTNAVSGTERGLELSLLTVVLSIYWLGKGVITAWTGR